MTHKELNTILEKHRKWLTTEKNGERADLSGADLRGADLSNADLRYADLSGAALDHADLRDAVLDHADLREAVLSDADISSAGLYRANLRSAVLFDANLCDADLRDADLRGIVLIRANLCDADLYNSNLRHANLRDANLYNACLSNVDLSDANLNGADLFGADLSGVVIFGADLRDAKNVPFIPFVCPEEGSFIGFKKAYNNTIVKLEIPADAKRSSATTRKCRCNKAKVLSIQTLDEEEINVEMTRSVYDSSFIYEVGKTVEVKDFDNDRWKECAAGIHFFINRQEAVDYQ